MSTYERGDTIVDERGHSWKVVRKLINETKTEYAIESPDGEQGTLEVET